jgi:hypothetical protein
MIRGKELFVCFIDITKAYDSVDRETAWKTLLHRGAPPKLVHLVRDKHEDTSCVIRAPGLGLGEEFQVKTGFKQGDTISPLLFNLYMDSVVRDVLPHLRSLGVRVRYSDHGVLRERWHGHISHEGLVWILLYADDIALVANSARDLQLMLTILDSAFKRWGLLISVDKTKAMCFSKTPSSTPPLKLGNQCIQFVQQFKYLGQIISSNGLLKGEISQRVGKATYAFNQLLMRGIWTDKTIRRKTKLTIYKAIVRSILLYGVETWPISMEDVKRLETAQMGFVRRICGYPLWEPGPSFQEVRARYELPSIKDMIRYHRLRWFGHVNRQDHAELPWCTLFGGIDGPLLVGRHQRTWVDAILDDLRALSHSLNLKGILLPWREDTQDRTKWRNFILSLVDAHT